MTDTIKYTVDSDGIALLTIDLPGTSMNVLTPELMDDLEALVDRVAGDDAVKGAVLTSGKKAFIAGADIKDMVTAYDRGVSAKEAFGFSWALNRRLRKLETCGNDSRPRSTGWRSAAAWKSAWPATTACSRTTAPPCSASRKSTSACCPAPAAPSARRV